MEVIDRIKSCLVWLENEGKSNSISPISKKLDELSLLAVRIGTMVSDAYKLVGELEDDYDIEYATNFSKLTSNGTSAAAAKPIVEAELAIKKREWTSAKTNYNKLKIFLDRLDKVMESHRQSISVSKLEIKNI